ncbi:MAG: hypothetical protein QF535_16510 [Anaerolineales bacterium]|jgi:predicted HicB family RNase H-like nuclease|nr:hypothetical protein [Anaerolineales bacterium]
MVATIRKPLPDKASLAQSFAKNDKPTSGRVPSGDVRLTANIRDDLHQRLKIHAAKEKTSIRDLIESMIESNIP